MPNMYKDRRKGEQTMGKRSERQMQILQNYFSIQENTATLELVYDTFTELLNPNFGGDNIKKLNDKLFSDISEAVSLLPRKFKLNLHIVIKDLGEYERAECDKIIKQNIYLAAYRAKKTNYRKLLSGCSLIGIGAAVLIVSYLLRNLDLWFDLINISGTLFVWEGVNMAFLKRNLEHKATRRFVRSIQTITVE